MARPSPASAVHAAQIKHDLGKYIAFQIRWVDASAPLDERREALSADLLATRRGPEGTRDAVSVWAEIRGPVAGEPESSEIDARMARIAALLPALADGSADEARVSEGFADALAVAELCRTMHRRLAGG